MRTNKKKRMLFLAICLTSAMGFQGLFDTAFFAANQGKICQAKEEEDSEATASATANSSSSDTSAVPSDMTAGISSDISISGVQVQGSVAGNKITISFTASGNTNSKQNYAVDQIEKIYPSVNDDFPFSMNDEAYRITSGTGNTLSVSYTLRAKDNLSTAYYPTSFYVIYSRKSINGKTKTYDDDYYVTKAINVKLKEKKVKPTATPKVLDTNVSDEDITLDIPKEPKGIHGQTCPISFTARSQKYKIKSVMLDTSSEVPFELNTAAYKVFRSSGTASLSCKYPLKVKKDVVTGYQSVSFKINYLKNKTLLSVTKSVNVYLKGKAAASTINSVPRVMVTGFTTNKKKIYPNGAFQLNLKITNNAGKEVRNIKFTLSTANGEFLPVSGASTAFVDAMAAKSTKTISFQMQASSSLLAKSYPITLTSEYEDVKKNSYTSTDNVSIPVYLKTRISLTDITPPDSLMVGDTGDFSFSINNLGAAALSNVTVTCKGTGFQAEDSYVGNVAAGGTGYATVTLTGKKAIEDGQAEIEIHYENASGENMIYHKKTNVTVMDAGSASDTEGTDSAALKKSSSAKKFPLIPVVAGGVVVLIAVILIIRKLRKNKRLKKEQELIDDELL